MSSKKVHFHIGIYQHVTHLQPNALIEQIQVLSEYVSNSGKSFYFIMPLCLKCQHSGSIFINQLCSSLCNLTGLKLN
jgi:hypothetical protein